MKNDLCVKDNVVSIMKTIVLNDDKIIKMIYHISDIHIRLDNRIEEYNNVFNRLYNFLRNEKEKKEESIIVVTGDIMHIKDRLTPHCMLMCYYFLLNLSNIFPLLYICGNHDTLIKNKDSVDSLTAIFEKRESKDLHYLKYSGIYKYGQIKFGVSSLIDDLFVKASDIKISKGELKIGLYHGPVCESSDFVGYKFDKYKLLNDFKGYDYVLLGDIHKYHYVDKHKRVGYASSLISQNFSENDDYHGVLCWDLKKETSYYKIIENEYQHLVITIEDNKLLFNQKIYELNEFKKVELPLKAQIRIDINESDEHLLQIVSDTIKNKFPNVSLNYKIIPTASSDSESSLSDVVLNKKSYNDMLIEYCKTKLNDEEMKEAQKIISTFEIDKDLTNNKSSPMWDLCTLSYENMYTYGDANYVDFSSFPSNVVGLYGSNSQGKTSFINATLFSLFNEYCSSEENNRSTISESLINHNKKEFKCEVTFKVGDEIYGIYKSGHKTNKGARLTNFDFYKLKNGKKVSLNTADKKSDQREINKLIGEYKDFCLTTTYLQTNEYDFKRLSSTERKNFLIRLLKLDIFDNINNSIKLIKKDLDYEKGKLMSSKNNISLELQNQTIAQTTNEIHEIQNKLDEYNNEIIVFSMLKDKENREFIKINNTTAINVNNVVKDLKNKKQLLDKLKLEYTDINNIIASLNKVDKKEKIFNKKTTFDKNIKLEIKKLQEEENILSQQLIKVQSICNIDKTYTKTEVKNKITKYKNKLKLTETQIESHKQEIIKYDKQIIEYDYENINIQSQNHIDNINEQLIDIISKKVNINEFPKNEYDKNLNNLEKFDIELETLINIKNDLTQNLKNLNNKLADYKNKIHSCANIQTRYDNYIKNQNNLNKINELINSYNKLIGETNFNSRCKSCCQRKQQLTETINIVTKLNQEKQILINENNNNNDIIDEYTKYVNISDSINEININIVNETNKLNNTEIQLKLVKVKIDNCENIIEEYQDNIINKDHNTIIDEQVEKYINKINDIKKNIDYNKNKLLQIKNKIKNKYEQIEIKLNDKNKNKLRIEYFENYHNIQNNKKLNEQITKIKDKIYVLENSTCKSYDLLISQLKKYDIHNKEKINISNKIDQLKKEIKILTHEYETTDEQISNIEHNKKIQFNVDTYDAKITKINSKIATKNKELIQLNTLLIQLKTTYDKSNETNIKLINIDKQLKLYNVINEATNINGIPLIIINSYLPIIQNKVNCLIFPFTKAKTNLRIDNDKLIISYTKNNKPICLGGMENFIANIGFKIALSQVSMLPKCNLLFIDEGVSVFDSKYAEDFHIVIDFLKKHFKKILLVTHIDIIKSHIPYYIEINKKDNYSHIYYDNHDQLLSNKNNNNNNKNKKYI